MSFKRCWTHMTKYMHKGFIKSKSYDSQYSTEYKQYMNCRFQNLHKHRLGTHAHIELGMKYETAKNCHEYVIPYSDVHLAWQEEVLFLNICANKV